jgi:hypothetical protein
MHAPSEGLATHAVDTKGPISDYNPGRRRERQAVGEADVLLITEGDPRGPAGGTNGEKIVRVGEPAPTGPGGRLLVPMIIDPGITYSALRVLPSLPFPSP